MPIKLVFYNILIKYTKKLQQFYYIPHCRKTPSIALVSFLLHYQFYLYTWHLPKIKIIFLIFKALSNIYIILENFKKKFIIFHYEIQNLKLNFNKKILYCTSAQSSDILSSSFNAVNKSWDGINYKLYKYY